MAFMIPSGWTRTEGYPKITGNMAGCTLVDMFYCDYDLTDILMKVPVVRTKYDESNINPQLAELLLSSYNIEPIADKSHAYITLNYQPSEATTEQPEFEPEYFLENATLEKALETHENFLIKWNCDLYQYMSIGGGNTNKPSWYDTAKDDSNATGATVENSYAWAKDKPSGASDEFDWLLVEKRIKPGVDSYIIPSPIVQERIYYRTRRSAELAGNSTGSIETPEKTFGISGGDWLVMSASMQRENRRYLVERSFQWAEIWDTDLYS